MVPLVVVKLVVVVVVVVVVTSKNIRVGQAEGELSTDTKVCYF